MTRAPEVKFEGVTKRFGPTVANDSISCRILGGSVHAFLGENGAGKTTLMKMLGGSLQPDAGRILIDGSPADFRSPDEARRLGIGIVDQHFSLIPAMSVLDNVILGDARIPLFLSRQSLTKKAEAAASRLGFAFNFSARVRQLSISARQKLEIFKLLWRDARVLVLDEPTSQLAPFESEEILTLICRLASEGRTILIVSHSIAEMLRFATRVSVLRKGRCIVTVDSCNTSVDELARLMVGDLLATPNVHPAAELGSPLFALREASLASGSDRSALKKVTIEIRSGEILGFAGVVDSGRDEIAGVLAGQLLPMSGSLEYRGNEVPWTTLQRSEYRAAHVPADALNQGTAQALTILDNLFLGDTNGRFRRGPFLRRSNLRQEALRRLERFGVHPSDPDLPCSVLSGGNLQRLVLARETALSSPLLIAVNPTAGLDFASALKVKAELRACAANGKAVVVASHNLQELFDTCDRIAVLFDGEVVGVESTRSVDSSWAGLLMGGVDADIVRVLFMPQPSENGRESLETKAALLRLLESPRGWERRLGVQSCLRILGAEDAASVEHLARAERSEELRAWFAILLAHLAPETHLNRLALLFEANPGPFLAIQRSLVAGEDEGTFKKILRLRVKRGTAGWERVLAGLTLRHLGEYTGIESAATSSSNMGNETYG